ncbi:hypothetical protein [Cyanothece sp. BG0011]|uniref:TubC N-terminal docking domain-related protein n=1 Tax=Cyanothece sp. BG0011 TaxID=2082950 RepID=UPI001E2B6E3F|nr:hypothetical protein [Cyanothece sp. BG0011]
MRAGKGVLTDEYKALLKENKTDIIKLLQQNKQAKNTGLPPIIADPEHRYQPFL